MSALCSSSLLKRKKKKHAIFIKGKSQNHVTFVLKWIKNNVILYDRKGHSVRSGHCYTDLHSINSHTNGPRWRAYKTFQVRKKSFNDAEKSLKQRAGDLAKNGFYYKGLLRS